MKRGEKKKIHIAIMRRSWGLIDKILSGEKTIESRWYKNKYRPWGQISSGDEVYFKDSCGPVRARAIVVKVLQFENLNQSKTEKILAQYGQKDLGLGKNIPQEVANYFKNKKYCLLILLKNAQLVKPFQIDKTGFGAQASWLIVDDLSKIKI